MFDIKVNIEENDIIEPFHRFGKLNVRLKSKKTIVHFVNKENCIKIFENKKKLVKLNHEKCNFREGTRIFVSKSLTPMNESSYSRNGVININMSDKKQPVKIFYMERLVNLFIEFSHMILRLEKCTLMHLRILMPLYI